MATHIIPQLLLTLLFIRSNGLICCFPPHPPLLFTPSRHSGNFHLTLGWSAEPLVSLSAQPPPPLTLPISTTNAKWRAGSIIKVQLNKQHGKWRGRHTPFIVSWWSYLGLDKQPQRSDRGLKSDTSAPTPTVSHRSSEREEVALFA